MALFPFSAYDNPGKSVSNNNQQLINWYVGGAPGKYESILYPTPGTVEFADLGTGSAIRGSVELNDVLYVVSGNKLFTVNSAGSSTERGTLNTSSGRVDMAASSVEIMIVDGTNGYTYNIASTTFTTITDADFSDTTTNVTFIDGYFVVPVPGTQNFQHSNLSDGLTWNTADIISAESLPDDLVAVSTFSRRLLLFGEQATDVYFNSGDSPVFQRDETLFVNHGCAAEYSIAEGHGTVFWMGKTSNGRNEIVVLDGGQSVNVATEAIVYKINTFSTISDAFGYCSQYDGHRFYTLTFPTEEVTFVYDVDTQLWHQMQSYTGAAYTRFRANTYSFFSGKHIIGDYSTDKLYELSNSTFTDAGQQIRRIATTAPFYIDNKNISVYNMFVDVEHGIAPAAGGGSDPSLTLTPSYDGGHTFGTSISRDVGQNADYTTRAEFSRLGTSRNFVFKLEVTDPIEWNILGIRADVEVEGKKIKDFDPRTIGTR